jgi:hypothetical protein
LENAAIIAAFSASGPVMKPRSKNAAAIHASHFNFIGRMKST